jgi:hypothetical protein
VNEEILNPTIFLGSLEIREPMTTLTDLIFAAVGFWAYYQFSKQVPRSGRSHFFFMNYFLFMGIGMTAAGIFGHGLQAYVGWDAKTIGWTITSVAFLLLQMGVLRMLWGKINNAWFWIFNTAFIVQIVLYWILLAMPETRLFKTAQLSTTVSLIFWVIPLCLYAFFQKINPKSLGIVLAIVFAGIPALVFNTQFSLSQWFNYHDISHVLSAAYLFLMYRGTRQVAEFQAAN